MKISAISLLIISLLISPLAAPPCNCSIRLYVEDPDTNGTNLRDAPKGKIIGKIPYAKETFNEVHAIDFTDSWFRIDSITFENGSVKKYDNAWIHSSVVKTGFDDGEFVDDKNGDSRQITPVYSSPSYKSKSGEVFSREGKTKITGCKRMWLKVYHTKGNKSIDGWWAPEDQCANPLTNCINGNDGETKGIDVWGNR